MSSLPKTALPVGGNPAVSSAPLAFAEGVLHDHDLGSLAADFSSDLFVSTGTHEGLKQRFTAHPSQWGVERRERNKQLDQRANLGRRSTEALRDKYFNPLLSKMNVHQMKRADQGALCLGTVGVQKLAGWLKSKQMAKAEVLQVLGMPTKEAIDAEFKRWETMLGSPFDLAMRAKNNSDEGATIEPYPQHLKKDGSVDFEFGPGWLRVTRPVKEGARKQPQVLYRFEDPERGNVRFEGSLKEAKAAHEAGLRPLPGAGTFEGPAPAPAAYPQMTQKDIIDAMAMATNGYSF